MEISGKGCEKMMEKMWKRGGEKVEDGDKLVNVFIEMLENWGFTRVLRKKFNKVLHGFLVWFFPVRKEFYRFYT